MVGEEISRASPGDAAALVALRDRLAFWLQGRGIQQWRAGEFGADRMQTWIGQGAVDVCRADEAIVAAVAVLWDDAIWPEGDRDAGYIHLLMVDREAAGQGLGDLMLAHAESRVRQAGRVRSRLDAISANPVLHLWYRRRGYLPVGAADFDTDDMFAKTTLFEKLLPLLPPSQAAHSAVAEVESFLKEFVAWAETRTDVQAVGLAGSWARGAALLDSDVDLVIIVDDARQWLVDDRWFARFGEVATAAREDWGAVQSWRIRYCSGLAIEYGLAMRDWLRTPPDEGTERVIADGFLVLYDPHGDLGAAVHQVAIR